MRIAEDEALQAIADGVTYQGKVYGFRQRSGWRNAAKPQRGRTFHLVDIVELRNQIFIDRRAVSCGLGDEDIHVVIGGQVVAPIVAGFDDLAPIGHQYAGDAPLVRVEPRVPVDVFKDGAARSVCSLVSTNNIESLAIAGVLSVSRQRQ